jgi:hypothetical protein
MEKPHKVGPKTHFFLKKEQGTLNQCDLPPAFYNYCLLNSEASSHSSIIKSGTGIALKEESSGSPR